MNDVVTVLGTISSSRNECYEYPNAGFYTQLGYITSASAEDAVEALLDSYPANTAGLYRWSPTGTTGNYGYAVFHKPAFIMQLLAATLGNQMTNEEFGLTIVADYLKPAKHALTFFAISGNIPHPHYLESYYLLATKIAE